MLVKEKADEGQSVSAAFGTSIPLFPLNVVLFPGGALPLRIFEQRYMDMAKACLRDDSVFGVCLIREGREVGAAAIPEEVGCSARIEQWDMLQLGVLNVLARGQQRFRILTRAVEPSGLARAEVRMLVDDTDAPVPEEFSPATRLLRSAFERLAVQPPAHEVNFDSCAWVSSRLAEILPLPLPAKQELLELKDGKARLARVNAILAEAGLLRGES